VERAARAIAISESGEIPIRMEEAVAEQRQEPERDRERERELERWRRDREAERRALERKDADRRKKATEREKEREKLKERERERERDRKEADQSREVDREREKEREWDRERERDRNGAERLRKSDEAPREYAFFLYCTVLHCTAPSPRPRHCLLRSSTCRADCHYKECWRAGEGSGREEGSAVYADQRSTRTRFSIPYVGYFPHLTFTYAFILYLLVHAVGRSCVALPVAVFEAVLVL
jgi:hypothetical protein